MKRFFPTILFPMVFALCLTLSLSACHKSETKAEAAGREGILLVGSGAEPQDLDPPRHLRQPRVPPGEGAFRRARRRRSQVNAARSRRGRVLEHLPRSPDLQVQDSPQRKMVEPAIR